MLERLIEVPLYKCDPADNLKIPDRCNLNSKEWTSGRHDAVQDIPVKVGQLVTPYVKATLADSVEVFNVLLGLATSSNSKLGKSVFERLAREHRVGMAEAGQVFLVRKGAEEDCTYIIISPIDHLHIQLVANKDKWGSAVGSAVPIHRNK